MQQKKSLGQNFLKSKAAITKMVEVSGAQKGDTVLEIGPGMGILTSALLATGANVISVEKDDRLIPILQEKFKKEISSERLELVRGDILNFEFQNSSQKNFFGNTRPASAGLVLSSARICQEPRPKSGVVDKTGSSPADVPKRFFSRRDFENSKFKLVANIPYYITGQVIRKFLEAESQPSWMTMLVQKEVAERIVAKDGKESLLSLSVKAYGEPKYIQTVKRGSFDPAPNVDSAIIHIANISRKNFADVDEKNFFKTIHAGFAHKRKQLLPNLSALYSKDALASAFEKLSIPLKVRAEDVPLEKWIEICKSIN